MLDGLDRNTYIKEAIKTESVKRKIFFVNS